MLSAWKAVLMRVKRRRFWTHIYKHTVCVFSFSSSTCSSLVLVVSKTKKWTDSQREEIQLKTDGLPTLRNEAFKEEEEEALHHREECESLLSRRDKNANTRAAHAWKRGSLNFKSTRAHAREREKEKDMNKKRWLLKKRRRHQKRTRSRIFLRDEQPFKRAVPVPLEDVGEVFDRFFGGFVEP